jgi:muramoyltetrapeptide carboxypeptidase
MEIVRGLSRRERKMSRALLLIDVQNEYFTRRLPMVRFIPSIRFLNTVSATIILGSLGSGSLSAKDLPPHSEWLKPPALKPGDTIALVAPAGPVELAQLKEYAQGLESAGYHVSIAQGIDRKSGYLAGSDQARADELNAAIHDPKVRAIFPCTGGYGLTRILDQIDYAALRRDPKIIIGFSDLTALHLAIGREARLITFHSPMPNASLRKKDKEHAFANGSFERALFADRYEPGAVGYTIALPAGQPRPTTLVGGKARGRLTGGNLTLISSTLGTPYAIEPQGKILMIEDVHEAPYRIDRYLSQLRLAGALDSIAGVVAGGFTSDDPKHANEFDRILGEYFVPLKKPAVTHFPVGHITNNATLPMGAMIELDADTGTLRVLENPVRLDRIGAAP